MAVQRIRTGTVDEFDEALGAGTVRAGTEAFPFHCTAIADGSRSVPVGATVVFSVVAGRGGTWEATQLVQV